MFCSLGRNLLCASIALFLAALPSAVSSEQEAAKVVLPVRAGIISIRLESNKAIYRRGEAIELRVTLVNHTSKYYAVPEMLTPWMLCRLSIRNGQGRPVRVSLRNNHLFIGNGAITDTLPPNRSVPVTFWAGPTGFQAWTDINYWGYELSRPGDYTIVGSPAIDALERIGDRLGNRFLVSPTETSNTVHIKILK
jgi:hypothetical protein